MIETKYSIAAFIDLLGFSSHLSLANNDLRTEIGEIAVRRLQNLEDSLRQYKKEKLKFKEIYPSVEIFETRFNDAIFITMEIGDSLIPKVGVSTWDGLDSSSFSEYMNVKRKTDDNAVVSVINELVEESYNIAKFVGIISRLHETINSNEKRMNFPGARTVISTGLKVNSTEFKLDAFSANFAISNAFLVGEAGSKAGFGGNSFYVESSVTRLFAINKMHHLLLVLSNISFKSTDMSPFEINFTTDKSIHPIISKKHSRTNDIQLFGKKYTFYELNHIPFNWIQVHHYISEVLKTPTDSMSENILKKLKVDTSTLNIEIPEFKKEYEVFYTSISFDDNVLSGNFY